MSKLSDINRQLVNAKGQLVEKSKLAKYLAEEIADLQSYVKELEDELYRLKND